MRTVSSILFIAVCLASTAVAAAPELTVLRTLGGEDDDLFLHNPAAVTYAPDGTIYLLNSGECQVLHLDADWQLLNSFGRCGKGPGEFETPVGMVLYNEQLWVFEMARIVVYDLEGELVRTIQPGCQFAAPIVLDGRLLAIMGSGDTPAAYLDADGRPETWLGPECPVDFFEAFKACRNMRILPHDDGACLLLNPIDGRAVLVAGDGSVTWDRNLIEHEDSARYDESEDGAQVSMSLEFGMGLGCRDATGRYWVVVLGEEEDDPASLRVLDAQMNPLADDIELPEEVFGWELLFSPDGHLVLVSPGESTIVLCDVSGLPDDG